MRTYSEALSVVVESHHGEDFDHVREDDRHVLVTILAEGELVGI